MFDENIQTLNEMFLIIVLISLSSSSTFVVLDGAWILPDLLHTYLVLNSNGSPYKVLNIYAFCFYLILDYVH